MSFSDFKRIDFEFEGKEALVILPNTKPNGKWAIKTEYFGAFPLLEIDLLNEGFHLIYIKNTHRWASFDDIDQKARFIEYICKEYGLDKKGVLVGMSCGGMFAIRLASAYPQLVLCLYLDAPVVNLLSCPCYFGKQVSLKVDKKELYDAMGLDDSTVLSFKGNPIFHIERLIEKAIPCALVYGEADETVVPSENAEIIKALYEKSDVEFLCFSKPDCGHHPHGLEDNNKIIEFINKIAMEKI